MANQSLPTIPRRRLGRTELSIPVIPYGTQGFGNNFGHVSDEDAIDLIKYAVSIGSNHFDCARCYGDSLRKLGLAMKEIPREDVIITARLCCHSGADWGGYGQGEPNYSADRTIADLEDQLKILNIDYLDGMLIHDPRAIDPTLEKGGTLDGLLKCKERGLVRFVGYGMHPHDFHLKAIATGDVDLLLCFNDYNLVRQSVKDTILPAAAEADIGVMNGWSILRGILTDVNIDDEIERGRWKKEGDVAAAYPIWEWCVEEGISILQLAIQFCLREERIHGNNIGSLNKEQLNANVIAASTPIPDDVWEKYEAKFGSLN